MPYLSLNETQLYYEEEGHGQPILFIHGVWMSGRFSKSLSALTRRLTISFSHYADKDLGGE